MMETKRARIHTLAIRSPDLAHGKETRKQEFELVAYDITKSAIEWEARTLPSLSLLLSLSLSIRKRSTTSTKTHDIYMYPHIYILSP